jgi:dGTPase
MGKGSFAGVALFSTHPNYTICIDRVDPLYHRSDDIRSQFARDYNRILHCTAYRRLKHKTQVFFATTSDHICTRIEHVNHVTAVSYTIAKYLGLNTELTNAIALGHDLGHAPFGHAGETFINKIIQKETGETFWHEKNSLRFVDECETLEDPKGNHWNLNLTYGVRDGIISHCGEVDENGITPRSEAIDLKNIQRPNEFQPYTWEGCVVKISDKIAYLGRDIEDAISLKILSRSDLKNLIKAVRPFTKAPISELNNTVIMHDFIIDLCENSTIEKGICLSHNNLQLMNELKKFNYESIYNHWKIEKYKKYAELVISSIYEMLRKFYQKGTTFKEIIKYSEVYPNLCKVFLEWLEKYSYLDRREKFYKNKILYDLNKENDYIKAIVDFIAGMTDSFAIKLFNEIIMF